MKKIYKDIQKGKSYFYYYGWMIAAFLLAFFLIFFFIFQAMFYVKRTEKIELFIAAHGLKDDSYSKKIQKEFKSSGLIEMNVYSYMEDDSNLFNYFSANGEKADYIIFSETNVQDLKEYVEGNYIPLSSLQEDVPSIAQFETYQYGNEAYGIKIFDGQNETYNDKLKFTDLISFTKEGKEKESYYLLVDNESPNFNKEKNHTLGYSVLEYLLADMVK